MILKYFVLTKKKILFYQLVRESI